MRETESYFCVPNDVETTAEQEHEGGCEVGIRDLSVQQPIFCRKIESGPSFLTLVLN
jgi:hypothetical protein